MKFLTLCLVFLISELTQEASSDSCNCPQSIYVGASGRISSPNYPNNYCQATCYYQIISTGGHVKLTINNYETESGYDFIYVYDGPKTDDPENRLAKISGTGQNAVFYAGKNVISLKFAPDGSQFMQGFTATWQTVPSICGGSFNEDSGLFATPNWPYNYPDNAQCLWTITAPAGKIIQLSFANTSRTEPSDLVTVAAAEGVILNTFSGANFQTVTSPGNVLVVQFSSDYDVVYPGFLATYRALSPANNCSCGDVTRVIDSNQPYYLRSPNYPNSYCINHNCTWYLVEEEGNSNIRLSFNSFSIENYFDNLMIYDGLGTAGRLLETCTGPSCKAVISSGSMMTVVFVTDGSVQYKGFEAVYQRVIA